MRIPDLLTGAASGSMDGNAQEKRWQALEQLHLLANQSACWHVYKQRAAQVRARLEPTLPPDSVHEAERRAQQTNLKEAVTAILNTSPLE